MKLVKTQEEAMLENTFKRSFSAGKRGTSTKGWWKGQTGWDSWGCHVLGQQLDDPCGAFQLRMLYDSMIQKAASSRKIKSVMCIFGTGNGEKDLYMDGCFVSVNHLYEESLDSGNDSMKTQSLPWLSEGPQRSCCMRGLSTGCVLASE